MYEIKAYHCSYCKRNDINKSKMKKHESMCFYNPETTSCITCLFLAPDERVCVDGHSAKLTTFCPHWKDRDSIYDEDFNETEPF